MTSAKVPPAVIFSFVVTHGRGQKTDKLKSLKAYKAVQTDNVCFDIEQHYDS